MTDTPQAKEAVEALAWIIVEDDSCKDARDALRIANAIIAKGYAPRSVTIEECAKVADELADEKMRRYRAGLKAEQSIASESDGAEEVATAIRSLTQTGKPQTAALFAHITAQSQALVEAREAIDAILACIHQPDPARTKEYVKPRHMEQFTAAIRAARSLRP